MEEKRIIVTPKGRIEILSDGSIGLVGTVGGYTSLGTAETARQYAHAILELCGEAPKEEPERDNCYIAVEGKPYRWKEGRILAGITGEDIDAVKFWSESALSDGEFHIFRRVATVGPIPQPEREVTRYE